MDTTVIECLQQGTRQWVRVIGRATMKSAPMLRDALLTVGANVDTVWLDLSNTLHLDSTVLGCLVGVKKRHGAGGPELVLNSPSDACLAALRQLKLDRLLRVENEQAPTSGWLAATEPVTSRDDLADMVTTSHEQLAAVNPDDPNLARIAKTFRRPRPSGDE